MAPRVLLAGYNLDRDLLREIRLLLEELAATGGGPASPAFGADPRLEELRARVRLLLSRDNWTPETISAAYARVSRDPRSVTELRALAREEVDRARRSNETIIFGLGHSSVAEHAVFNFDVLGLSRLAVETLERSRLASYTEKSQRYILLEEDWTLPEEIRGTAAEAHFRATVAVQNRFYREAYERLLPVVLARSPGEAATPAQQRTLEGLAKEDARYALSLATTVQLGLTANARTLESILARCRAHALQEVRELAEGLSAAVAGLAPSLVKYEQPSAYRREAWPRLRAEAAALAAAGSPEAGGEVGATTPEDAEVRLVSTTPDPDGTLAAVLLFAAGRGSMAECRHLAGGLDFAARRALLLSHCGPLGPHDPILREYEHVDAVFELVLSASAFAQLKRHRMATITALPYDPALGVTVPPALAEAGLEREFRSIMERSEECARRIAAAAPGADPAGAPPPWAAYALTNAHRRRVLVKMNARELYHLSRLREDAHAQWDIRRLAARMVALARARMPLTLALAAGKDRFAARRESELS